jgi:hypothetical protein
MICARNGFVSGGTAQPGELAGLAEIGIFSKKYEKRRFVERTATAVKDVCSLCRHRIMESQDTALKAQGSRTIIMIGQPKTTTSVLSHVDFSSLFPLPNRQNQKSTRQTIDFRRNDSEDFMMMMIMGKHGRQRCYSFDVKPFCFRSARMRTNRFGVDHEPVPKRS